MRDTGVAAQPKHVMSGSVGAIGGRAIKFAFNKLEWGLSRPERDFRCRRCASSLIVMLEERERAETRFSPPFDRCLR